MSKFYNIPPLKHVSKDELGLGDNALLFPPLVNPILPNGVPVNPEEKDEVEGELNNLNNTAVHQDEKEIIENPIIDDYESNPTLFRKTSPSSDSEFYNNHKPIRRL